MASQIGGRASFALVRRLYGYSTPWQHIPRRFLRLSHTASQKLTWSYVHGPSSVPLKGLTIGKQLENQAEANPDGEAVVFCRDGLRRTIGQLLEEADQLAAGLLQLGLKKGDRVGIWGPNSLEWVLTQFATARAGIILVNINPQYMKKEVEYALRKVGCKALIAAQGFKNVDYYEILYNIIPELATDKPGCIHSHLLPELKHLVMIGDTEYRGAFTFSDIMDAGTSKDRKTIQDLQNKLQFDDPINIQFTSGTTGFPKGATLSHHNILNNCHFVGMRLGFHDRESRLCLPVPLYHTFGSSVGSMNIPIHGICCVFPSPNFESEATLQAIQAEKCTALYAVPTMMIDMLNHPRFAKYDLSSLYTGVSGGTPCPIDVMRKVTTEMHMPEFMVAYGMTETSPAVAMSYRDSPLERRVTTVGQCVEHCEIKVVNEQGELLPVDSQGELCVRGYNVMLGYWDDKDKTDEVVQPDRWLHTGDTATIDEDGYCKIVGRTKDMIIRGGENIYPAEIENLLHKNPKVKAVQVFGVPDERLGEEVAAWIQLKDGQTATEEEVKGYCRERLARFKVPRYVQFVSEYPLTVSGKVQKFKLREEAVKKLDLEHIRTH